MRPLISLAISIVVFAAVPVLGDDLNPPPWRGADGTTMTVYEFSTDAPQPLADVEFNPYGQASANVYPGVGQVWWPVWGGEDGVWPLSGRMEFGIPNRPEPLPFKEIWVQVTWASQVLDNGVYVSETISGNPGVPINDIVMGPTGEPSPAGENWHHTTFKISIEPNPDFEIIKIGGGVMIDEVVIDTICFPEPATLSFLALGGLVLLRRRR